MTPQNWVHCKQYEFSIEAIAGVMYKFGMATQEVKCIKSVFRSFDMLTILSLAGSNVHSKMLWGVNGCS